MFPSPLTRETVAQYRYEKELALVLEWLIRNPDVLSPKSRFWILYHYLLYAPIEPKKKEKWIAQFPYRRYRSRLRVNHAKAQAWLAGILKQQKAPEVRFAVACHLPGGESGTVFVAMTKENSTLAGAAALLYAGRLAGPHPFNAVWLEEWVRKAGAKQLEAVEMIFAGNDNAKASAIGRIRQLNKDLGIPTVVAGLFLRYHERRLSKRFKERFLENMKSDLQEVHLKLDGYPNNWGEYPPQTPQDLAYEKKVVIRDARRLARSHIAWPREFLKKLGEIKTADREARALIARIIASIRSRQSEYPTGQSIQAAYASK